MGVHISKVRSLRLDLWDMPTVEVRQLCGCLLQLMPVSQPATCCCVHVCVCLCVCVRAYAGCMYVRLWCVLSGAQFMESMGNEKLNELYEKQLLEMEVEKPQANASK